MVRFYKRIQDQWFYKECWQDGDRVIFHHVVVGNEGKVDSEHTTTVSSANTKSKDIPNLVRTMRKPLY